MQQWRYVHDKTAQMLSTPKIGDSLVQRELARLSSTKNYDVTMSWMPGGEPPYLLRTSRRLSNSVFIISGRSTVSAISARINSWNR